MANNRRLRAKDLNGLSIHHGEKQTFLYDMFDRTPRVIQNEDAQKYSLWQMRTPAAVLVGCLLFSFNENVPLSFIFGVVTYVVLQIAYEFLFVKQLEVAKKFTKEQKDPLPLKMSKELSNTRLYVSVVMTTALAILLVVYANLENYQGFYLIFTYLLAAASVCFTAITTYAIILKKKNSK